MTTSASTDTQPIGQLAMFTLDLIAGNLKNAMSEAGATRNEVWKVPRAQIHTIEGFNVRNEEDPEYIAHIRYLADSIKANGFLPDHPLTGYVARENNANVIYITGGHSRLKAVDLAVSEGIEAFDIPIIVKPRGTSSEDLTVELYTGNSGKPLTPFEVAAVCKRLIAFGWDEKTIAGRLGLGVGYVKGLLDLAAAPKAVRDMVAKGKVSASLAMEALKTHGNKAAAELKDALNTAEAKGKTKATAKHMKPAAEKKAKKEPAEKVLSPVQDKLADIRSRLNVMALEGSVPPLGGETTMPDDSQTAAIEWLFQHALKSPAFLVKNELI